MKITMKKSFAVIMALVMCVSMLFGMNWSVFAADESIDYKYSSEGYVYNWGTREDYDVSLSPMAKDYYRENGVRYSELIKLSGSSTESSISSSALYKELQSIMIKNHTKINSYGEARYYFPYTDCQNITENGSNSDFTISAFYSGLSVGPAWNNGQTWNREHVWPNSKGKEGSDEDDIMMLRPENSAVNSGRSNDAFGNSSNYFTPYHISYKYKDSDGNDVTGTSAHDLRGDVARIILYQYVRWGVTNTGSDYNPTGIFGTSGIIESQAVLLNWMQSDPVDTWEMGRNDSVESITGTRNIFVDYPEFAFKLFEEDIPNFSTPSGGADVDDVTNNSKATIFFDDINKRTEVSTDKQVWTENGITVTNLKGSGNPIDETKFNPIGFYNGSEVSIEYASHNITKIEITANTTTYANKFLSIFEDATVNGKVVTVTPSSLSSIFSFTNTSTVIYVDSITLFGEKINNTDTPDEPGDDDTEEPGGETDGKPQDVTISFASTAQRSSFSTSSQVWKNDIIKFTNNKASSTNPVADYSNPVRLYANSEIIIECDNAKIEKIVFVANTAAYATALKNSIGAEATVSGTTVTITPSISSKTYTIAKLTAQVRLNSLTVTATPTASTPAAVNFSQLGANAQTIKSTVGDTITLPSHSGAVTDGYKFEGWVTEAINDETTTEPSNILKAGDAYAVENESTTLYALYSRSEGGSDTPSTSSDVFEKYSGELTEGDYLIVYSGGAMKAAVVSSRLSYTDVTITNDNITSPDTSLIWTVTADGSYYTLYNESTDKYAAGTGSNNKAQLLATVSNYARWTVSGTSTYEFVNAGNTGNKNLRRNGTYGFACYSTSTGGALTLYKRATGGGSSSTTYYFTSDGSTPPAEPVYNINATVNDSVMGKVTVNGNVITAEAFVGHKLLNGDDAFTVTPSDITVVRDGNTFTVTGEGEINITINFKTRNYRKIVIVQNQNNVLELQHDTDDLYALPSHFDSIPTGWAFAGWTTTNILDEITEAPQFVLPNEKVTVEPNDDEDLIYYALYLRAEEDENGNTDVFKQYRSELTDGDYVITYTDANNTAAMKAEVNSGNRLSHEVIVPQGNLIISPSDAIIWSITKDGDYWTIYNEAGYAAGTGVANKTVLNSEVDDFAKWTASGTNVYEFVNLGNETKGVNKTLRRNGENGFACYAEGTGGALTLYKRTRATIYYFTSGTPIIEETDGYYVKVTKNQDDWSGKYLIVYEAGNVAFDGNRTALDADQNSVDVVIREGMIKANAQIDTAVFNIAKENESYTIQSNSGYYIGRTADSNSLDFKQSTKYTNTIELANDTLNIKGSGGAYLRYNDDKDELRFRYYKSSTYTGQEPIALYKYIPTNADLTGAQVRVGADLSVDFYSTLTQEEHIDVDSLALRVTVGDDEAVTITEKTLKDGNYIFAFDGVAPQRMTDNIKAEFLCSDGVLDVIEKYSIHQNAINLLKDTKTTDATKQFIIDMLYYGEAAQNYAQYNTENLATSGISQFGSPSAVEKPDSRVFNLSDSKSNDTYFKSATVWFDSVNKLIVKVTKPDDVNVKVVVLVNGVYEELNYNPDIDGYMTDGIKVSDFDSTYTFELRDEDDNVIQTLDYNVNSYVYSKWESAKMSELVHALYRLGISAENLINNQ